MKVTFSITVTKFPKVDETTAKEILPAYLHNGIKVKADDINVLSMEQEETEDSPQEKKDTGDAVSFSQESEESHSCFEEQMKHMED